MITKKYGIDFQSEEKYGKPALTLRDEIGENDSGWVITGEVQKDYYEWVNEFEAWHPVYGRVWGDFEHEVYADTEEGYKHFYENHTPFSWNYWDI